MTVDDFITSIEKHLNFSIERISEYRQFVHLMFGNGPSLHPSKQPFAFVIFLSSFSRQQIGSDSNLVSIAKALKGEAN